MKQCDEGIRTGGILMGMHPRTRDDAAFFEDNWQANRVEGVYR